MPFDSYNYVVASYSDELSMAIQLAISLPLYLPLSSPLSLNISLHTIKMHSPNPKYLKTRESKRKDASQWKRLRWGEYYAFR
jgi:hypothetical protein